MPDVRTVPALPWPTGDGGGTIKLSRRVTEQDLIDGILKITLDNAGREYNASIVRYQDNTLRVVADNDVFTIDPIPQTSDTLTLTRIAGEAAQAYSLISVELLSMVPGIYGFNETNNAVFRVKDDGTAVLLYNRLYGADTAVWYRIDGDTLGEFQDHRPLRSPYVQTITDFLANLGITEIDWQGEQNQDLVIGDVTILE